ncbi:class III signal peptide-containing protein [Methanococcus maripaludis]|uniref:Uncharacterized protein (UPF0333 family) n=2 Tax=Methanococcus maripaludis TaxID=39152 RepID=A0A7J9PFZ6_METMI|nr:class III signal peptide-containing protein [Methanococcus maripaludis]MBA2861686.1 uncharacterized protein (UPF0333 family) [Methanococcus maripaludis]
MVFFKLTSKKGQVSMEIGILVAAAVAVAAIAAYSYAKNAKAASVDWSSELSETHNQIELIQNNSINWSSINSS